MTFFIKRLTRNELGLTGARTHGEIYVPLDCLSFFPSLSDGPRPECSITVMHRSSDGDPAFEQFAAFVTLYEKGEAHLRRMKPVLGPHVQPGDLLALRKLPDKFFEASVIGQNSMIAAVLETLLGNDVAKVLTEKDAALVTSSSGATFDSLMESSQRLPDSPTGARSNSGGDQHVIKDHPMTNGIPPEWASEWGHDEYGPWCSFEVERIQQRLRWVPPGQFQMGVAEEYEGLFDEYGPRHWVTLSRGFWMFETLCSLKLFNAVMKGSAQATASDDGIAINLQYWTARDFCGRLGEILGGAAVTMPTDAHWEFACRAGRQETFEFLNSPESDTCPNPWGLRDMLSGVGEICWDGIREYTEEPVTDPIGNGESVSVRGLPRVVPNWAFRARTFRSRTLQMAVPHGSQTHPSFREIVDVDIIVKDAGFRCVITQDDWEPGFSTQSSPTVERPDTAIGDPGDPDEPASVPTADTPLAGLIRDMASHLHRYYSELIEPTFDPQNPWRLNTGHPLCDAGRRVVRSIPDSVPDSKSTPNFPERGGQLWYLLLRTSRRAKFEDARPFLIAAAKDLAVWLQHHYPKELPHTFVVGNIPLTLRLENLQTILTVRNLSPHMKVGTGTTAGWPANQHPLLYAAVDVLVAIPDAITASDGTLNFPGVGGALWPRLKNLVMTTDDNPTRTRQRVEVAEQFREWLTDRYRPDSLDATGTETAPPAVEKPVLSSNSSTESAATDFDVFLSYRSVDKEAIEPIATELRRQGLTVFLDTEHLTPGDNLNTALTRAIQSAHCVVICVSKSEFGEWQRFEIESLLRTLSTMSDETGRQLVEGIIPVLLPGAPDPKDLGAQWNTQRWFDFRNGFGKKEMQQLVKAIRATSSAESLRQKDD